MEKLVKKYEQKLITNGLTDTDAPLFGALEDDFFWNRPDDDSQLLQKLYEYLNINSLLFSMPAEPYRSIIEYLASTHKTAITPGDCETRTFLHDLPITHEFSFEAIAKALSRRKSVIIPGRGIITYGSVTPEQAFVLYSSVCFACYVNFFSEYLEHVRTNRVTPTEQKVFEKVSSMLPRLPDNPPRLKKGPFSQEEDVYHAIIEAGLNTVSHKLVDSYFGNISYRLDDTLYISQTTSSLDELAGCIDPCPLDNSTCAGLTASSELSAHKEIVLTTEHKAILHGHPRFAVILSMDCGKDACQDRNLCFKKCPDKRFIHDIPIVPGEVGTGPYGLCNTMPPAIKGNRGVIVYGHGVFTTGENDFNEAFESLMNIEKECIKEYFHRVNTY